MLPSSVAPACAAPLSGPAGAPCPRPLAALPRPWAGALARRLLVTCAAPIAWSVPVAAAQEAPVALQPLGSIGCATCDDPRALSVVYSLAVAPHGVLLSDRDPPHVRLFARDGSLLEAWGPTGDGPGEVRFPMEVGVRPAGGAYVLDPRRSRITVLGADGREVEGWPTGFPLAAAFGPAGGTLWLVRADFRAGTGVLERWREGDDAPVPLATDDATLRSVGPAGHLVSPGLAAFPDGGVAATLGGDAYRILLFGAEGRKQGEIVRDVERRPRTPEELERLRERLRRGPPGGGGEAGGPAPEPDPLMPHFDVDALAADERGRLWVRTNRGIGDTVFDVFEGDRFVGEVRLEARVGAFAFGEGLLAAVVLDELDLPAVRLWRVAEGR